MVRTKEDEWVFILVSNPVGFRSRICMVDLLNTRKQKQQFCIGNKIPFSLDGQILLNSNIH